MQKILIVEDDEDISSNISQYLREVDPSLDTVVCSDGISGLTTALTDRSISLMVLDLGLPDLDGVSVCVRLRGMKWNNPIIMLTARDTVQDKIRGLECGADDYVVKPFSLEELSARVHAQLRRSVRLSPSATLTVADLILNTQTREVTRAGTPIKLSANAFKILALLMRRSPAVVTHEELIREVWPAALPSADTIRSHMYMLRNAVDKPFGTPLLETIPAVGWALREETGR